MRKYCFILLFYLSCSLTGLSQQSVDSLRKVLLVAKDTQRINALNLLSSQFKFWDEKKGYLDTASNLSLEALVLSKKLHYMAKGWQMRF